MFVSITFFVVQNFMSTLIFNSANFIVWLLEIYVPFSSYRLNGVKLGMQK